MTEITFELDRNALASIDELMKHYKVKNHADLFKKGIAMLQVAAYVNDTGGAMYARNGEKETKLNTK